MRAHVRTREREIYFVKEKQKEKPTKEKPTKEKPTKRKFLL